MSAPHDASRAGIVLSDDELSRIREQLREHPWYRATFERFRARVDELLERRPEIPVAKARAFYESCPRDHAQLIFDPYEPHRHVCPKCGEDWSGDVYDLAWLRQFQGWHAKRLVEAGIVHRIEGEERYARLVRDAFRHFVQRYRDYPLANNLLGPTRLFQSTFLEAFWLVDMVAAYDLTRSAPCYGPDDHAAIRRLLYESCRIVQGFDEGISNRQAFNNAGMGAVALLYDDEDLLWHVLEGPHGFAFHMRESLREDGIWYEGETYHFATLDHSLNLAEMARHRGIDLYEDAPGRGSLRPMFYGPLKVLLPDLTFPSRKDSWFGRGVGYHREVYELGYARYADARFGGLLAHAYAAGADRTDVAWRTFLYLEPELPEWAKEGEDATGAAAASEVGRARPPVDARPPAERSLGLADLRTTSSEPMPGTGAAVLRSGDGAVYVGLEYGHYGGGHGHPDRLHLTLFADGEHWLVDPGTGWYHVPELGWYRSTLAHDTVTIDGASQNPTEGTLAAFGSAGGLHAVQAVVPGAYPGTTLRRTLCLGDGFLLDALDVHAEDEHTVDWTFHVRGEVVLGGEVTPLEEPLPTRGGYPFLADPLRLEALGLDVMATRAGSTLRVLQPHAHHLLRARAPGVPLREDEPFHTVIARRRGSRLRFATVWAWGAAAGSATAAHGEGQPPAVRLGEDAWSLLVDDAPGVALVAERGGRLRSIAWFSRRQVAHAGVHVSCDRVLERASLTWQGDVLVADLPREFGRIRLGGGSLPRTTDVDGLPDGASWRWEGDDLVLRQRAALAVWPILPATIWTDPRPQRATLAAGREGTVPFGMARYGDRGSAGPTDATEEPRATPVGGAPEPPDVTVPEAWRLRGVELLASDGTASSWSARVGLPPDATGGELGVGWRSERAALRVDAEPPLALDWSVRSDRGEPGIRLRLRDASGLGGWVRGEVVAPWLTRAPQGLSLDLEPGGAASVRLPLPGAPIAPVPLEPRSRLAPDAQPLDPMDQGAGEFPLAALVRVEGFTGVSRVRIPLAWCRRARRGAAGGRSAGPDAPAAEEWGRMRLDRPEQAYWAERPWAGPADASASAELAWDDDGVHLDCLVRDDDHVSDANAEDLYENDSLQLYLDFRPPELQDASFAPGVAAFVLAPDADLARVRVEAIAGSRELANRGLAAPWFTAEGVVARVEPADGGYRMHAFMPYASLGTRPLRPGQVFRADLSLSDNDGGWYRNTQLVWSGARGDRRCYLRWAYLDPMEYGYVVVGDG